MNLWTAAIVASALFCIAGKLTGRRVLVYVFKPLPVFLALLWVANSPGFFENREARLIAVGLLFSLFGDIFLMLPKERFLAGLVSFFLAHIAYAAAFIEGLALSLSFFAFFLGFLGIGLSLFFVLYARLGRLKGAVFLYVLVLAGMVALAGSRAVLLGTAGSSLAFWGALLFMTSDALLAINRWRRSFYLAELWILGAYFAAQVLIACSVR